jgi:hypothetical protein
MQQVDSIQLVPKVATIFNRVVHFFASSRVSTRQSDQVICNIDWPDSDPDFDPRKHYHGPHEQPISGGYNEAFIVQYWTSYHLR